MEKRLEKKFEIFHEQENFTRGYFENSGENRKKAILIAADDQFLRNSLELACEKLGYNALSAGHTQALKIFSCENYFAALVCDYSETGGLKGKRTYGKIKELASGKATILRAGFSKYGYADYLQIPFQASELKEKLNGG